MTKIADRARACRLLLVEDNQGDVFLFQRTVERLKLNIDLIVERTADAAIARLRALTWDQTADWPDLILTDLNLPGMSGIELVRAIKTNETIRQIPVVVFTSSEAPEDIVAAYDAQANGYLSKATSLEQYETALEELTTYWFNTMQTPSPEAPTLLLGKPSNANLPDPGYLRRPAAGTF